jgi:hypothetical protein
MEPIFVLSNRHVFVCVRLLSTELHTVSPTYTDARWKLKELLNGLDVRVIIVGFLYETFNIDCMIVLVFNFGF